MAGRMGPPTPGQLRTEEAEEARRVWATEVTVAYMCALGEMGACPADYVVEFAKRLEKYAVDGS